MRRSCIIIGAGLGGLAGAIRLQHSGWDVTVLEKNGRVGGRCSVLHAGGFTFDTGPTLLLMRDVFEELFRSAGRNLADYLDLVRVCPNYVVHFADGSSVELSGNLDRVAQSLEGIEAGAGEAFRRYLRDAGYKYRVARARFVERNFYHWYDFVTAANLYYLFSTNALRPLDRHARRYFRDPRLVAAFTFQAMYLGLSPHEAPAVYSLLPYTEITEGIWFPRGGMYRVAEALASLAVELGVRIETDAEVVSLETHNGRVRAVQLARGERREADVVISNADLPYAYDALVPADAQTWLGRQRRSRLRYGSSAFLLYLGLDREYARLNHHNVYLSADPKENFEAIFRHRELPRDPSFYTCVASKADRSLAPPGCDGLYVLVPVPAQCAGVCWPAERDRYRDLVLDRLEHAGIEDIRGHISFERIYTPDDFAADYNVKRGSAFGISHNFWQVGYLRPSNRATRLDNLYFIGASTQPGGGMPMVLIGSRLTVERIQRDWTHA